MTSGTVIRTQIIMALLNQKHLKTHLWALPLESCATIDVHSVDTS